MSRNGGFHRPQQHGGNDNDQRQHPQDNNNTDDGAHSLADLNNHRRQPPRGRRENNNNPTSGSSNWRTNTNSDASAFAYPRRAPGGRGGGGSVYVFGGRGNNSNRQQGPSQRYQPNRSNRSNTSTTTQNASLRPTEAAEDIYVPQQPVALPPAGTFGDDDDNNNNNRQHYSEHGNIDPDILEAVENGRDSALRGSSLGGTAHRPTDNNNDDHGSNTLFQRPSPAPQLPSFGHRLGGGGGSAGGYDHQQQQQQQQRDSSSFGGGATTSGGNGGAFRAPAMSVLPPPPSRPPASFGLRFQHRLGTNHDEHNPRADRNNNNNNNHNPHHLSTVLPDDLEGDIRRARNAGVDQAFIDQLVCMSPRTRSVILTDVESNAQRRRQHSSSTPPSRRRSPTTMSSGGRSNSRSPTQRRSVVASSDDDADAWGGGASGSHRNSSTNNLNNNNNNNNDNNSFGGASTGSRSRGSGSYRPSNNAGDGGSSNSDSYGSGSFRDGLHFAGASRAQREGNFMIDMLQHVMHGGNVPDEMHARISAFADAYGVGGIEDLFSGRQRHAEDPWNAPEIDESDVHGQHQHQQRHRRRHHHNQQHRHAVDSSDDMFDSDSDGHDDNYDDDGHYDEDAVRPRPAAGHANRNSNLARTQRQMLNGQDIDSMSYEELSRLCDQMGSVNTGLDPAQLPSVMAPYRPGSNNGAAAAVSVAGGGSASPSGAVNSDSGRPSVAEIQEEVRCAVCLESLTKSGNDPVELIVCGHAFHKPCIEPWLLHHPKCPICNQDPRSFSS